MHLLHACWPDAVADFACLTVITADVALGKNASPIELRSIRQRQCHGRSISSFQSILDWGIIKRSVSVSRFRSSTGSNWELE
jgi:hypothetical protein